MKGTKVIHPLLWALPPAPARREVIERHPPGGQGGPERPGRREERTHVEPIGRPPLLFVHGANHAAWCWESWMDGAAGRGWPSYAVSLRGHGASSGGDRLSRTKMRDYEHDVMQTIVDLPEPPVLVGHSMGAIVVRRVLARYRPRAAVLVAPAGARHGIGTFLSVLRRHPESIARIVTGRPFRLHADDLFPDPTSPIAQETEARLGLEAPLVGWELTLAPRWRAATAPVLVLGGADDPLVHPAEFVRTARLYGSRAHLCRGMGHDLMVEPRWREPLDLMLDWLDRELATP